MTAENIELKDVAKMLTYILKLAINPIPAQGGRYRPPPLSLFAPISLKMVISS